MALLEKKNILVVDDIRSSSRLLELLLSDSQRVLVAGSALEALNIAQLETLDLILLDLHLPDMHGSELAKVFRADPRTRAIPIVAVSACDDAEDQRRAHDAGIQAFVIKPVDGPQLRELVARYVQHK